MKTTSSFTGLLVAAIAATLALAACKKTDETSGAAGKEEFATGALQADAEADVVFDDVFNNVMGVSPEVGIGGTGVFGRVEGVDSTACFSLTAKQLGGGRFPLQCTIDFGPGCIGRDGRTRKGRIIIVYTGHLLVPGNTATTTFDNYSLDNVQVEGSHALTNTGSANNKSYTSKIVNAKLTEPNGSYTQWNSEKTIAQTEGGNTPQIALDDTYTLTGQSSGTAKTSSMYFQWSTAIATPLTKKFTCRWISKGTINLKKGNDVVAVLDYGNGGCDNRANFSVNNVVKEITLH